MTSTVFAGSLLNAAFVTAKNPDVAEVATPLRSPRCDDALD